MDAADHSVGDHGRTHGTGHNLVPGHVERRGRRFDSSAPLVLFQNDDVAPAGGGVPLNL